MLEILGFGSLAVLVAIGAVLAIAARRPDTFQIARTARIAASPERLFPLIDDLRRMNTWNPYALRETGGISSYEGPASGKGAAFAFAGSKSGSGRIEIVDSTFPREVVLRLSMVKPFKADNTVTFTLEPHGPATDVTWAFSGRQPLLGKVMGLVIDCDRMMGRDFEEGLANLKAIAERAAVPERA
jgi:uncharacterized protein YndB with AHSA1/START domain